MRGEQARRITAANANFVESFAKLVAIMPGAELRRFGPAVAFDSRVPIRIFNGLAVLEPTTPADVREALSWLRSRDIPHAVWVQEELADSLRPTLRESGYEPTDWAEPVMAIEPPADPPSPPAGVSIQEVIDEATLEGHIRATVAGGMPNEGVRMVYQPVWLADPDLRMFTAYVEGSPVGHSIAIRSGDTSGIYSVGVRDDQRKRGIGTAATWAAVRAGLDWGCSLVVLQSSRMGFGVYRRMGFEVLTRYEMYRTPPTDG